MADPSFPLPRPRPRKSAFTHAPSKKRKTTSAIEEINFDFDKRADYLTGFHKRKVQRAKRAQEEAKEMERKERILQRKQLREERKQELEAHVEAVNTLLAESKVPALMHEDSGDDSDGWGGIKPDAEMVLEPIDREEEYIDEDKYTTVTVESVDVTRRGMDRILGDGEEGEEAIERREKAEAARKKKEEEDAKKKTWPKKEKKQKFRYESKAERKFTRMKQKSGNKKQAAARKE